MRKKDCIFKDGAAVKVREITSADLDTFEDLTTEAMAAVYDDPALAVFARSYYPIFAACTDNPPPLEKAYKTDDADKDAWFAMARELNPDFLGKNDYREETIKLNGKNITVKSLRPSVDLRFAALREKIEKEKPLDNLKDEIYRTNGYIGAAAASFGKVPSAHEARHELSLAEFRLWHETVRRVVPEWYETNGNGAKPSKADAQAEKKIVEKQGR